MNSTLLVKERMAKVEIVSSENIRHRRESRFFLFCSSFSFALLTRVYEMLFSQHLRFIFILAHNYLAVQLAHEREGKADEEEDDDEDLREIAKTRLIPTRAHNAHSSPQKNNSQCESP